MLGRSLDHESDLSGVKPRDFQRIDDQGLMVASDRSLDVALNGKAFFIVNTEEGGSGKTLYTRDGSFNQVLGAPVTVTGNNNPCLSGCNPHPLYVGCAVIRQARVSEWKLMF